MRYASVCDGISAASVAWGGLGWQCMWRSEIDPACCSVLAHHWPDTPNLGDMEEITDDLIERNGPIDLLVGGTPCQSFSVAGKRAGLDDPRGNLALVYARLAARSHAQWVVWENVPGVLSSGKGRDFPSLVAALHEVGYGVSWRVLDAQYFGVPQRRRRVFLVGHLGDWRRAAAVLLERSCMQDSASQGGSPGRDVASTVTTRFGDYSKHEPGSYPGSLVVDPVALYYSHDYSHERIYDGRATGRALTSRNPYYLIGGRVRRFTPREAARLQGFPDTHLESVTHKNKPLSNTAKYKMLGNSMAVPVMAWIGKRIQMVEELTTQEVA